MKIKISDEEFKKIYYENSALKISQILGLSQKYIYCKARRLGLYKRGIEASFVSMKKNPNVIPGGLPQKEYSNGPTPQPIFQTRSRK